jgi:hypothetical protein
LTEPLRRGNGLAGEPEATPDLFSYHRYELPLIGVLVGLGCIELVLVHLLVALWSAQAAWLLSILTVAGLVQIGVLVHRMAHRPILVGDLGITVRYGMWTEIFVPLDSVSSVEDTSLAPEAKGPETFRTTVLAHANITLRLCRPIALRRFGRDRKVAAIAMRLDQPAAFRRAVAVRLAQFRAPQTTAPSSAG